MKTRIIPAYDVLEAPFIKIDAKIIVPGATNGKPNLEKRSRYVIAPSAKKISTYIVKQIFGSDLVTQTEGLNINWLMPTLKDSLEKAVYEKESFIYIHKFDNKIYLECLNKSDIHNLVQKFDKVISCEVVQEFDGLKGDDLKYELHREIKLENGNSYIKMTAFEISKKDKSVIPIEVFNKRTASDYLDNYILPYEVIINIDIGEEFFRDSKKFLNEEMIVVNTLADEIEKTQTRIVTTQHYQSGDIVTNWKPGNNHYEVQSINVGQLQDYFTLLPGDKEHQMFEFLQGDIRWQDYVGTFKFYDQQIIQMAGLSPASFGYEKDAYMNTANVDLSSNNSEMTVEAIKTQIEPQINNLIENIIKAQQTQNIKTNLLPNELIWDYGINEKYDDMKKLQVLSKINAVASIPYKYRAKIINPILNKLIDENIEDNDIKELIEEHQKEDNKLNIEFGEI